MKKITRKLSVVIGAILCTIGILFGISSSINHNNLGLGLSMFAAILGVILIAIGFD
ncbi:MAG: hypothetical protein AABY07_06415 [Nanoarchaeota archaeon]